MLKKNTMFPEYIQFSERKSLVQKVGGPFILCIATGNLLRRVKINESTVTAYGLNMGAKSHLT